MNKQYVVLFEKTDTGYAACVPELPTILVAGDTLEETKQLAGEAIAIYREEMASDGLPIPEPHVIAELVEART